MWCDVCVSPTSFGGGGIDYECRGILEREREKSLRKRSEKNIYIYIYQHTWMPAAAVLRPCKVVECGPY